MKTKKYFVPKGREKFLSTVLNRDGLNHDFEENRRAFLCMGLFIL